MILFNLQWPPTTEYSPPACMKLAAAFDPADSVQKRSWYGTSAPAQRQRTLHIVPSLPPAALLWPPLSVPVC